MFTYQEIVYKGTRHVSFIFLALLPVRCSYGK